MMLVKDAKAAARAWVNEHGVHIPGFSGAFFHGSINWAPDDALLPASSDLDVMVVLTDPSLPNKPGKLNYHEVMLEISYISLDDLQSPATVLAQSHMAGSFHTESVIADPTGHLTKLQAAVSKDYAKRFWVRKRCESVLVKIQNNLNGINEAKPFHDQVLPWLFATGLTTHVLLVAGLKNPTVRKRYLAARELLADYGRLDFYETLLELLGCAHMSRERVEQHLDALTEVFDVAKTMVKTPFFFTSDISDIARPIAIDGSREMIERGYHRETIFWIVATYSRCQTILYHDAPAEMQAQYTPAYHRLLSDLGINSYDDLQKRSDYLKQFLPQVWEVAETIIDVTPDIQDESTTNTR